MNFCGYPLAFTLYSPNFQGSRNRVSAQLVNRGADDQGGVSREPRLHEELTMAVFLIFSFCPKGKKSVCFAAVTYTVFTQFFPSFFVLSMWGILIFERRSSLLLGFLRHNCKSPVALHELSMVSLTGGSSRSRNMVHTNMVSAAQPRFGATYLCLTFHFFLLSSFGILHHAYLCSSHKEIRSFPLPFPCSVITPLHFRLPLYLPRLVPLY